MVESPSKNTIISDRIDHYKYSHPFSYNGSDDPDNIMRLAAKLYIKGQGIHLVLNVLFENT